jgi:nitroreductase
MDVDTAIRTRRTHKAYAAEPVDEATLRELFELARWAPNHHVTNLAREAELASPGSASKLDRAPTLVVASATLAGDETQQHEDLLATAVAAYIVLLGAHARGLAGYWRTLPLLETPSVRAVLGIEPDEQIVGLLHLGYPRQPQLVPERAPVDEIATFLD